MTINPTLMTIRTKKLGVLIRDARQKKGKSLSECAAAIGISEETLEAYEYGERSPSLPELEMLAYYLEIPLDHFWGNETLKKDGKQLDPKRVTELRQRMIGALIRKARMEAGISPEDFASKSRITVEQLLTYELGEAAVPLPELEMMAQALNTSVREFQDRNGPTGVWFLQQRLMHDFMDLSPDIQNFVCKPVNRPYLELAVRLSEMQVEKLRAVAEGLLEITL